MSIEDRLAAAKARLAAAKAATSDEARKHREMRSELARVEAEARAEERARLRDDLDQRIEALDSETKCEGLMVEEFDDTFIVVRNGKAHADWQNSLRRAAKANKSPIDSDTINRRYAIACVVDWNGINDFDSNAESTHRLDRYLIENPGIVTPITDLAGRLAGVFAEERSKSG